MINFELYLLELKFIVIYELPIFIDFELYLLELKYAIDKRSATIITSFELYLLELKSSWKDNFRSVFFLWIVPAGIEIP